jgi:hypothetical protein
VTKFWQWVVMHAFVIIIATAVGFAIGMIIKGQYL